MILSQVFLLSAIPTIAAIGIKVVVSSDAISHALALPVRDDIADGLASILKEVDKVGCQS